MTDEINIRKGNVSDWDGLAGVFHTAVRDGALRYTEAQRVAWSPASRAGPDWSLRMARQNVKVAEIGAALAGFMTLEMNGYLDCAYIMPDYQGRGLFRRLYVLLEAEAAASHTKRIHTHASLHACPAFEAMGFTTIKPETVSFGDIYLPRFHMEKILG